MESLDPNVIFLWRAIERLANVLIGALSIYLGYKLFINLPERREDENGKLKLMLPGDISVYVSRVGPGIFFALFGSAIVLTSMVSTLDLSLNHSQTPVAQSVQSESVVSDDLASADISYSTNLLNAEAKRTDRAEVKRDLLTLRKLEQTLNFYLQDPDNNTPSLSANDVSTLLNTLLRVKQTLMLSVWEEQWGDPDDFSQWVQDGAMEPVPENLALAAQLFSGQND